MLTMALASGRPSRVATTVPLSRPSPVSTLGIPPRYNSRRMNPVVGTSTSMSPVLSASRLPLTATLPAFGTLHSANHPLSPVTAVRRGTVRTSDPRRNANSSHSPVTVAPDIGDPSFASRTTPIITPLESGPSFPQTAARKRAGEGIPRSDCTGRPVSPT